MPCETCHWPRAPVPLRSRPRRCPNPSSPPTVSGQRRCQGRLPALTPPPQPSPRRIEHLTHRRSRFSRRRQLRCEGLADGATAIVPTGMGVQGLAQSTAHGLAVLLGYFVIAGSLSVKVPQIVRILKSRSVEGISVTAHVMETLTYTIGFIYNARNAYPFSTYGELVSCWIQNVVLGLLLAKYRGLDAARTTVALLLFACFCKFLLDPSLCSMQLLSALQASTLGILVVGARLPQIILNIRRGGTGELSSTSFLLLVAGNSVRVFTSLMLTGDLLLIGFNLLIATCNFVILMQIWVSDGRKKNEGRSEAQPGVA